MEKGIDISSHQGIVDFKKVKQSGYSFVIVKAGQGFTQMKTFRERYLPAIEKAGLEWGAYWWSDAVTVQEATEEAKCFLKAMDGLKPTYPLWMDQEYGSPHQNCTKQQRTQMVTAFLDTLRKENYYPGLYCSYDWLENWLIPEQLEDYDKWIAQYADKCSYTNPAMWQHTVLGTIGTKGRDYWTVGKVPGVEANCDVNYAYREYPTLIKSKGLNGWKASNSGTDMEYKTKYEQAEDKLKRIDEILREGK